MGQYLPYLLFLGCPISMSVMMWMMMRRDHGHGDASQLDPRLAELQSQVNDLRTTLRHREPLPATASTPQD